MSKEIHVMVALVLVVVVIIMLVVILFYADVEFMV